MGSTSSGKSTLARFLAVRLGLTHIELDALHWRAGWSTEPPDVFRGRVAQALSAERWVVDGNYGVIRDLVWPRADTVVWLDLPRRTLMRGVIWRSVSRAVRRPDLWSGHRDHRLTSFAQYKAMTALTLLMPGTPMLFQGQEFAASTPFFYFADHKPELARLVHSRTEGNAFFVQQVARDLIEREADSGADEDWGNQVIEVPASVRAAIGYRLSRLEQQTRQVLQAASVLGQTFSFEDLHAMTGRADGDLEASLDEARMAGLVRESDADSYTFDHVC